MRNTKIFDKQLSRYPHKEAPTPEGFRVILVRNTPAFFTRSWKLFKWMVRILISTKAICTSTILACMLTFTRQVTKRDQSRVHLFAAGEKGDAKYRDELFKHVDPDQVPKDFGGNCDCPWSFCGRSMADT